jgi:aminomethyltransferase
LRVGLELEGKRIAREGAAVLAQGKEVGRLTSGTFAPTIGKAIAMAYVDPKLAAPGTACEVDIRGKPAAARVTPLPFYKRPKS